MLLDVDEIDCIDVAYIYDPSREPDPSVLKAYKRFQHGTRLPDNPNRTTFELWFSLIGYGWRLKFEYLNNNHSSTWKFLYILRSIGSGITQSFGVEAVLKDTMNYLFLVERVVKTMKMRDNSRGLCHNTNRFLRVQYK